MKIKVINSIFFRKRAGVLKFIMRIFLFLFCTTVFSFSSNEVFSQTAKVYIDADKVISVDEVFNIIRTQTDYTFLYHEDLFKGFPLLTVKRGSIKTNELLNNCFNVEGYDFSLTKNNTIIISPKRSSFAIQQKITGKITDVNGVPLLGVTVLVKGTKKGTYTDFDGLYSINAAKGDVISFSYVGFEAIEQEVTDATVIDAVLLRNATQLDEVVLSTGYQKISKERATGSFDKVDSKVLETKISQDILSKIEGELSGILFDDTDGPVIRGIGSLQVSATPLVVVDGFPISQGLESINPNDVKDITVLKDAAAASIWGIRAANGVIVITTKKGNKNRKPIIEFSTNYSVTPKNNLEDLKYASTSSFLEYEKHRADNEWSLLPVGRNQPALGAGVETYLKLNEGLISQADADGIINGLRGIDSRKEFQDLFMNDSYWSQYNFAISGGGENSMYRSSVSYNKNESNDFFKNNDSDQLIANLRGVFNVTPKLTISNDFNFTSSKQENNGMSSRNYEELFQYQNVLDANGNQVIQPNLLGQDFKEEKVAEGYPYNWDYNLMQEFNNRDNTVEGTSMRIQTAIDYKLLDNLSIQGSYQYEWSNYEGSSLYNENTYYVRNLVNTFTREEDGDLISHINKGSILDYNNGTNKTRQGRIQLNFNKSFDDAKHRVTALAGYELRQVKNTFNSNMLYGFDPQALTSASMAFGERVPVTASGGGTRSVINPASVTYLENRFVSYYANGAYTYLNKYTVTGSIRLDDTNLFGASKDYRNTPLYSLGGKWDIYNEGFFKGDIFNSLSLRGTYGVNGNVDRNTGPHLIAENSRHYATDVEFAYIRNVKNPELRLEKVYVTNLGLDFGLFNNVVSGNVDYYYKKSTDLLSPVSFPSVYGFNNATINVGEMENEGVDVNLNINVAQKTDLKYSTTLRFSHNKNTVTKVDVPEETVDTYLSGQPLVDIPLRYIYSYKSAGLDANGDPLTLNENGQLVDVNGRIDVDGTLEEAPIQNTDALVYSGTTTPKYYGSWVNNISYKNFYVRTLVTYKLGHVFRNTNVLDYRSQANNFVQANIHSDFENRWQNPGDENITSIPRIPTERNDAYNLGYYYYANGDQFVDSASHIRFKEIIFGYNFDSKVLENTGLDTFRISLQARNIGLINFNKWNEDPESFYLPTTPTFTLNFTLNF